MCSSEQSSNQPLGCAQRIHSTGFAPATVQRGPGKVRSIDVRKPVRDLSARGSEAFEVEIGIGEGTLCRPEDVAQALGVGAKSCTRVNVVYQFEEAAQ